jgi:hypothetical protein
MSTVKVAMRLPEVFAVAVGAKRERTPQTRGCRVTRQERRDDGRAA